MILAGDIGATKAVLAIYKPEENGLVEQAKQIFKCKQYHGFDGIVRKFFEQNSDIRDTITAASFGVAGPVADGRCEVTNLPWVVDAQKLGREFAFSRTELLNDLEAIATAVPHLGAADVETLNTGDPVEGGTIGVIAPGTGLGEAFLVKCGAGYTACPSEGGHSDISANNKLELDLVEYLLEKYDHASFERVISGDGIPNIYNFLKEHGHAREPEWLHKQVEQSDDPAPVISQYSAGEDAVDICRTTMRIFAAMLGAEAGNLALKLLARGGIYLGGGIPPLILPILRQESFAAAFRNKGRMSGLLASMPVYVITNPEPALLGAAWRACA